MSMNRRSATALAATICVVVLLAVIVFVPVPFVSWSPGTPQNALGTTNGAPVVAVDGKDGGQGSGQLLMVPVSVTKPSASLNFPQVLASYLAAHRDVLPRDWVYPVGQSVEELEQNRVAGLDTAKQNATVSALKVAGIDVRQNPVVRSVSSGGPSYRVLNVGDIIETVDGTSVQTAAEVGEIISRLTVGDAVQFTIVRQGAPMDVTVTTQASASSRDVPRVGITLDQGYRYAPQLTFTVDRSGRPGRERRTHAGPGRLQPGREPGPHLGPDHRRHGNHRVDRRGGGHLGHRREDVRRGAARREGLPGARLELLGGPEGVDPHDDRQGQQAGRRRLQPPFAEHQSVRTRTELLNRLVRKHHDFPLPTPAVRDR